MAERVSQAVIEVVVSPSTTASRVSQAALEAVIVGDPNARVSQAVLEVPVEATGTAYLYQGPVEVAVLPSDTQARLYQAPVEVILLPYQQVTSDLEIDYVTKQPAYLNLALDYEIANLTNDTVGSEYQIDYAIGTAGGAHSDLGFNYVVTKATKRKVVGESLRIRYRVIAARTAGKNLLVGWEILPNTGQVGVDLNLDPQVIQNSVAGPDLDVDYIVEGATPRSNLSFDAAITHPTPSSQLEIDYALAGEVDSDLALEYEIKARARGRDRRPGRLVLIKPIEDLLRRREEEEEEEEVTYERIPAAQVSSSLGVSYGIARHIKSDVFLNSSVRVLKSSDFSLDWKRARLVAKDAGMSWAKYDFYDWNRQLILSEIDPDLPGVQ